VPTLGPSPSWNFADSWEAIARAIPDAPAQYGFSHRDGSELHFAWGEFDRRANGVARALIESGATHQDKVAQYMYNCPQYLESIFATFKAGLAPVNTNYRYTPDELVYIWDNADVVAVVFHGSFADTIDGLRQRVPRVALWLWVDDGSGECPTWATDYEAMASQAGAEPVMGSWGRSGDDLLLIYTGGTTGMPKGVMWRQEDLLLALDDANRVKLPPTPDVDALVARTTRIGPRNLPAAPLMHGTGLFNAMSNLMMAGSIVTMRGRKFDPVELLDTIELLRVNSMSIVGDAFAKPILRALDAEPTRWDLSSLRELGRVALRGHTPIGYYKDPEKSAKTFVVFDGVRWSIPGDWASVDADGTVQLLGRGSQCINTGGEKVYPEEVEEVLKLHPAVADAAVVGLPDDRFGQAITALVEPLPDRTIVEAELIAHVKVHLAAYKAPKRVLAVDTVGRAGNGKLDYKALTERAAKTLG